MTSESGNDPVVSFSSSPRLRMNNRLYPWMSRESGATKNTLGGRRKDALPLVVICAMGILKRGVVGSLVYDKELFHLPNRNELI